MHNNFAGIITEDREGYHFQYDSEYLNSENPEPKIALYERMLKEKDKMMGRLEKFIQEK
ncbi:hypothetical protein [Chryseobacterium sp. MDT2-18]|uniref:hypothetical protein n=1 Tax=Chryseobacterium sp. MDT2-18 TaxID=1259136 RepID=UPI0027D8019B|nr:hypothetical protein [Chryseobacterium sp. MDT2-18]